MLSKREKHVVAPSDMVQWARGGWADGLT